MAITTRTLQSSFVISATLAVLGAVALLEPHIEFAVFDLLDALHLPAPLLGSVAFYIELALIVVALTTGFALVTQSIARRRRQ